MPEKTKATAIAGLSRQLRQNETGKSYSVAFLFSGGGKEWGKGEEAFSV